GPFSERRSSPAPKAGSSLRDTAGWWLAPQDLRESLPLYSILAENPPGRIRLPRWPWQFWHGGRCRRFPFWRIAFGLHAAFIGRRAVDRRHRHIVEPQVDPKLGAMVDAVVHDKSP